MKKTLLALTILPLLLVSGPVFAKTNSNQDRTTILPSNEIINKDYFAANANVEVSGTVNGDVYVFGGNVLVDGTVNGDLIAAGGAVNVTGKITQNIRVAGGQVTINGEVGRNLSVVGGNVEISGSSTIGGSVTIAGGNVNLNAPVKLGAKVAGGNVVVSNSIGGDLESYVGKLRLSSKATVSGDVTYWSDNQVTIDSGAKVSGKVTKNSPINTEFDQKKFLGVISGLSLFFKIASLVSTFVLGLLVILLLPIFTKNTLETLRKKPWPSAGAGLIALIVTPIVAVILFITLLGIPLALIILPVYFVILYISRIFVVLWAGQEILKQVNNKSSEVWAFLVGVIVYGVLTFIPFVGGWISFLVIIFGLGAVLLTLKNSSLVSAAKN